MAREIYLLGCDESAEPAQTSNVIETWSKKLGQLGVGSLAEVRPTIFRSRGEPYAKVAAALFTTCNADAIYDLDGLMQPWGVPFTNKFEAAACLAAVSHYTVTENSVPPRHQQRIIIANQEIAEDFMRLNPSGMFAEVGNIEAGDPSYTYVYRVVSGNAATKQR